MRLLRQVADGNENAFRELFHRYADLLGTYVLRFTHSRECAEEIVQDIFLKIWMSREALAEVQNFKVYLYVISRNQTLNAMRKIIRQREYQREWEKNNPAPLQVVHPPEDPDHHPLGLIDRAIEQLPPQQKKVWLLSRQMGLSHKQIAKEMTLSQETVKKYIMYANQSMTVFIKSHFSV